MVNPPTYIFLVRHKVVLRVMWGVCLLSLQVVCRSLCDHHTARLLQFHTLQAVHLHQYNARFIKTLALSWSNSILATSDNFADLLKLHLLNKSRELVEIHSGD